MNMHLLYAQNFISFILATYISHIFRFFYICSMQNFYLRYHDNIKYFLCLKYFFIEFEKFEKLFFLF